jgi:multiple sugar transport system ATP-binding protein
MVFQNYAVFPHMTVFENIAFGLRNQKAPEARVRDQVARAASLMHIEGLLDRHPAQLSGGQRQRVACARALAVEPAVLLMDEPLSNLDALLRLEMRAELKSVLQRSRTTTIYVTHDQTEAMSLADRIAVMHGGRIVQVDRPMTVYARPATTFVGGFIGSPPMNFLKLRADESRAVRLGPLVLEAPRAGDLVLGLRGEDLEPAADGLPLAVQVVEPLGPHLLLTGTHADQPLRAVAPTRLAVRPGDVVGLRPAAGAPRWFDPATGQSLDPP